MRSRTLRALCHSQSSGGRIGLSFRWHNDATIRHGKLEFCTSSELQMEAFRQAISKQGYLGIDWFSDVKLTKVPCPVDRFASWNKVIDPVVDFGKDEQLAFFRSITHLRFQHLRNT